MAHPFEHGSESASALIACDSARGQPIVERIDGIRGIDAVLDSTADADKILEFDVVVIDNHVLQSIGSDSIAMLRNNGDGVRLILLTTAPPDRQIVGRCVDECLIEPVSVSKICRAVQIMVTRIRYDRAIKHFYGLVEQRMALDDEDTEGRLLLNQEIAAARETVDQLLDHLTEIEGYPTVFESMFLGADASSPSLSEG